MRIESIHLKNFRVFREVTIDKLPDCCVFIGANGTGKSSLFDLFGFLHDALTYNIQSALAKRGDFREVVSRGTEGPIELELKFRELKTTPSEVSYLLMNIYPALVITLPYSHILCTVNIRISIKKFWVKWHDVCRDSCLLNRLLKMDVSY